MGKDRNGYSDEDRQALIDALGAGGLQLPPQDAQPAPPAPPPQQPIGVAGPATVGRGPLYGGMPDQEVQDEQNERAWQALHAMTPEQRAAQMKVSAAGLGRALGGVAAPHKVVAPEETVDMSKVVTAPAQAPGQGESEAGGGGKPTFQTIPEHWVNTLDPESRKYLAQSQSMQMEGTTEGTSAAAAAAREMADANRQGQEDLRVQQMLDKDSEQKDRGAIEQHMADLQQRADALSKEKVDPQRYMNSKSTGERLMMGLALGLSAMGKTPEVALTMIHGAINDDIRAQEMAIENHKEGLKAATGLLADKWRLFGNKDQARAAARQELIQATNANIEQIARQYQSPAIEAKGKELIAANLRQFANDGKAIQQYVPEKTIQTGGGLEDVSDVKPGEVVQLPDGRHVTIPEKDREKVQTAIEKSNSVHEAANELRKVLQIPTAERAAHPIDFQRRFDAASKVLAAAEIEAGGKGGKGIFEAFQKAQGGRTAIFTPGVDKAIREIEMGAATQAHAAVRASAQHEVRPVLKRNAKGEVERRYIIKGDYQDTPGAGKPAGGGDMPASFRPVGS